MSDQIINIAADAATVTKPKRKKTARACNHCHKAHMTCDNGRPCKRCAQRGLQDTCEDAPRKKKKYLMDVPDPFTHPSTFTNPKPQTAARNISNTPELAQPVHDAKGFGRHNGFSMHLSPKQQQQQQLQPSKPHYQPNPKYNFLSSAADLEYSTLSNILHDNLVSTDNSMISPGFSTDSEMGQPTNHQSTRQHSQSKLHPPHMPGSHNFNQSLQPYISRPSQTPSPSAAYQTPIYTNKPKCDESINQYFLGPTETSKNYTFPDVISVINNMRELDPKTYMENERKSCLSFTIGIIPEDNSYNNNDQQHLGLKFKEPEEIYAKVKQPFSYTPGYHSLIAYLRQRFPKTMLVKLAKSMAEYRPSFIACTNTLKEEDLIFMEQCFQRTLLTYDNFISVNGTPTIVWRRTGQIAYVGNEFCVLTGWTKDQLLNKTTFIVELLDDESVVEYFQLFSTIAFGDFRGATMTECTVLTPNPEIKIRTGCMWTLKRDVFGIPMMIIGNFLPIL